MFQEIQPTSYREGQFRLREEIWKRDLLGSIVLVTVHDQIGQCVNGTACSNFIEELGGTDITQLDGRSGKFQI